MGGRGTKGGDSGQLDLPGVPADALDSREAQIERIRTSEARTRYQDRAEINYESAAIRVKRRDPLKHVRVPRCNWRPGDSTGEITTVVLHLLTEGHTIAEIRRADRNYPSHALIDRWRKDDPAFGDEFQSAIDVHIESRTQVAVDIASGRHRTIDDPVIVARDRLHADTILRGVAATAARYSRKTETGGDTWAEIVGAVDEEERKGKSPAPEKP